MKNEFLTIAHLSDLHFSTISWNLKQFRSKRWLGNWNLILFRQKKYQTIHLFHIPDLLKKLNTDYICVTGDLSSTSLDSEFEKAFELTQHFQKKGIPIYLVPGNHDRYTKEDENRFHFFFPSPLASKKVEVHFLGHNWWYVGLDCAVASGWFQAYGIFSQAIEEELKAVLNKIPLGDRVILANHFPLFPSGRKSHDLKNATRLQQITKEYSQIKLYLHGHDHAHYIVDKRDEGFPLVLNSGSCAHCPNGTFYLLQLSSNTCIVNQYFYEKKQSELAWVLAWEKIFQLN